MRNFFFGLAMFASGAANAAGMTAVADGTGNCRSLAETYCYEWALDADRSVRFVARGDEDIIDYSLFGVGKSGRYERLTGVHPVLKDRDHPGLLFWAYPWDISDIAIAPGEHQPVLLATLDHPILVRNAEGDVISNARLPAVLFLGRSTQPRAKVALIEFSPTPVRDLAGMSPGNSLKVTPDGAPQPNR